MTPQMACGSETYRADRRLDPTPINSLRMLIFELSPANSRKSLAMTTNILVFWRLALETGAQNHWERELAVQLAKFSASATGNWECRGHTAARETQSLTVVGDAVIDGRKGWRSGPPHGTRDKGIDMTTNPSGYDPSWVFRAPWSGDVAQRITAPRFRSRPGTQTPASHRTPADGPGRGCRRHRAIGVRCRKPPADRRRRPRSRSAPAAG